MQRFLSIVCLLMLITMPLQAQTETPLYLDPTATPADRAEDLLGRMTLEEKIGQMTLVEKNSILPDDITALSLGGLLSGGGGYPLPNTPANWWAMVNDFQTRALETRLQIPIIYGVDAVHGHGNVEGAVVFPHNIGLGATHNPELLAEIGRITALEMSATGIRWNYAPVVAVPQDIRWGRIYEGYSEDTQLVSELATAYLRGMQGENLADPQHVVGTPKHFVGDGGTLWGSSTTSSYQIDQGVTDIDETTLRAIHLPPYAATIEAGARSIMVSFSSWGGMKMHAQQYLITDVLKGELGFTGFVVSDWAGIDQITGDYYSAVVTSINAGVDMNMVPYDYQRFISVMLEAVEKGDIPQARIDDAVRRILLVKFEMGLFEHPFGDETLLAEVGSEAHRAVARQAVRESLVLLKNENAALPLAKDGVLFVAGAEADDIGIQAGGWTIEWQGKTGDIIPGTTLLEALEGVVPEVHYVRNGDFSDVTATPTACVVTLGEKPYSEGVGDRGNLELSRGDVTLLEKMHSLCPKLVVVIISGRPLVITDHLELMDAVVAAWLPGSEGQGMTDVLFGDYDFTGKLPYTWLRDMSQVPLAALLADDEAPLFPLGYGLSYQ